MEGKKGVEVILGEWNTNRGFKWNKNPGEGPKDFEGNFISIVTIEVSN